MTPPDFDRTSALFLDVDGTLLEIAARPELVVVPPDLPPLLTQLYRQLDGAVAIVSGRSLADIDRLFDPFLSSAAGEHGVAVRFVDGKIEEQPAVLSVPQMLRDELSHAAEGWAGVEVESKPHGVTLHYRLAPDRADEVWRLARSFVPDDDPHFRLLPARQAVEIGVRAVSKGTAVERLMEQPVFRSRRPIFVGDDFTDEAGMSSARRFGGIGLRVGEVFSGEPAQVRAWLQRGAQRLKGYRAPSPLPQSTGTGA